jgi:hypothetical protein
MITMNCDACKKEIKRNFVSERLNLRRTFDGVKVQIQIMVSIDGEWNRGELCRSCLDNILADQIECDELGRLPGEAKAEGGQ